MSHIATKDQTQWNNFKLLLVRLESTDSTAATEEAVFVNLHECADSVRELVQRFSRAIVRVRTPPAAVSPAAALSPAASLSPAIKLNTNTIVDPKGNPDDARQLAQTALNVEQSTGSQILLTKFIFGLIASKDINCLPAKQKGKKGKYKSNDVSREKLWCQLVVEYPRLVCLRELKWSGTKGVHLILKKIRKYLNSPEAAAHRARTILQQAF